MAKVGRHGSYVPRLHDDLGAGSPRHLVFDIPIDLTAELHEPLDTIVAVRHRQNVLLGSGAKETLLAHRAHRRIPGHV